MPKSINDEVAYNALQIAFQTMQERCQQLENRLAAVEEENIKLRIEKGEQLCSLVHGTYDMKVVRKLQERVEELSKHKSQLTHHILMVAAENRQLWTRLNRLTRSNKSLGSRLIKISDTLKHHPSAPAGNPSTCKAKEVASIMPEVITLDGVELEKDGSIEEISLRLINSIMLEKVELEQQYSEMVALQNGADINFKNVGFAYPDEDNNDSLQQLKQHEAQLLETKDALLSQQLKLKKVLQNLQKIKKVSKKVCQAGTQFDSDDSLREHGATQTSLPSVSLNTDKAEDNTLSEEAQICPMCGAFFGKSIVFETFHEHVLSHFHTENPVCINVSP